MERLPSRLLPSRGAKVVGEEEMLSLLTVLVTYTELPSETRARLAAALPAGVALPPFPTGVSAMLLGTDEGLRYDRGPLKAFLHTAFAWAAAMLPQLENAVGAAPPRVLRCWRPRDSRCQGRRPTPRPALARKGRWAALGAPAARARPDGCAWERPQKRRAPPSPKSRRGSTRAMRSWGLRAGCCARRGWAFSVVNDL